MAEEIDTVHLGVRLPDKLVKELDKKIALSDYMSRSEYVRALIRKDLTA